MHGIWSNCQEGLLLLHSLPSHIFLASLQSVTSKFIFPLLYVVFCCFQQVSDVFSYFLSCHHLDLSDIKSVNCP